MQGDEVIPRGGGKMSKNYELQIPLDQELLSKFNMALALRKDDRNVILKELVTGYIIDAFSKEVAEIRNIDKKPPACAKVITGSLEDLSVTANILKEKPKRKRGLTKEIRVYIKKLLQEAEKQGKKEIELCAGTIHKAMNLKNRMPCVCGAMISIEDYTDFEIVKDTPSGKSSTKVIKYKLH